MQLTLWTYEGPPHVGAMRIAASMRGLHYVLHSPQGDTYADLLFTMIERHRARPPVSYTTFQARDLGGDTANLVRACVAQAYERYRPDAMLVGESCTAELIQDQAGSLAASMNLPIPVIPLELPSYSKKENWGAAETLYQLCRNLLAGRVPAPGTPRRVPQPGRRARVNLLGPTSLGFRCRDDVREISMLLGDLGIDVNAVAPLDADVETLRRLPDADFNVDLYPEVSRPVASWMQRSFGIPHTKAIPMGVNGTCAFIREVASLADSGDGRMTQRGEEMAARLLETSRMRWYARSVDSNYLTGKRVFIFADATHAIAAARIAREEMGLTVVGIGTYSREFAREIREEAATLGVEPLVTDDYLEVEKAIAAAAPELVLGTQMERHIAKRLGVACAVISSPIHVQDVPARYSPVYGPEGANVLFDSWVHPLVMGLEEHLLQMFRDDFEFNDAAPASHLPASKPAARSAAEAPHDPPPAASAPDSPVWSPDGELELKKIPFFVRSKARRNTERYAMERGVATITVETLYDAKAHFGR